MASFSTRRARKCRSRVGNVTAPQTVIKDSGADILRLWVAASDYSDDLRIGPEILKTFVETYRKLRNTIRWMLGSLAHYDAAAKQVAFADMPELERLMLHRLAELDAEIRDAYARFDYKRVVARLSAFLNTDLSAFYFDIRKDTLYCDPPSSVKRRAALEAIEQIFRAVTLWLAPILVFTSEEAWLSRYPDATSVHLEAFPEIPAAWRDDALAAKWEKIRRIRAVVTGALEIERGAKAHRLVARGGADSLYRRRRFARGGSTASISPKSASPRILRSKPGRGRRKRSAWPMFRGVAVVPAQAPGRKCARSWKISPLVGSDAEFPDVTPRDAQALRELAALGRWP